MDSFHLLGTQKGRKWSNIEIYIYIAKSCKQRKANESGRFPGKVSSCEIPVKIPNHQPPVISRRSQHSFMIWIPFYLEDLFPAGNKALWEMIFQQSRLVWSCLSFCHYMIFHYQATEKVWTSVPFLRKPSKRGVKYIKNESRLVCVA